MKLSYGMTEASTEILRESLGSQALRENRVVPEAAADGEMCSEDKVKPSWSPSRELQT